MVTTAFKFLVNFLIAVNIQHIGSCPLEDLLQTELKAAYKSGEMYDGQEPPITLEKIKTKLRESKIFDFEDRNLNDREKKEMNRLFDAVEIMVSSRNRQPSSVQNMFSSLRMVERVVKKQLKEGQISEALAAKFNWEKLKRVTAAEMTSNRDDKNTAGIKKVGNREKRMMMSLKQRANRQRREKPTFIVDKTTKMRVFHLDNFN